MSSLAIRLSETSEIWAQALAPFAEGIARTLQSMTSKQPRNNAPATQLTQSRKLEAKGLKVANAARTKLNAISMCRICWRSYGNTVNRQKVNRGTRSLCAQRLRPAHIFKRFIALTSPGRANCTSTSFGINRIVHLHPLSLLQNGHSHLKFIFPSTVLTTLDNLGEKKGCSKLSNPFHF
jgi:hypothetical protein